MIRFFKKNIKLLNIQEQDHTNVLQNTQKVVDSACKRYIAGVIEACSCYKALYAVCHQ
jgi:hypothetical protein